MSYYELWNVLCQWREEFSLADFSSTFASPDPRKVLHDLCRKRLLARTGRGKYRVITQREHVGAGADITPAYDLVKSAGLPYAFTRADGVYLWTRGGYNVDRFFGFYPVHLKIARANLDSWKSFLARAGRRVVITGEALGETLFGVFYVLHPVERLIPEEVAGYTVEPLADTVRFCRKDPYAYQPALEMLSEMYHLGLSDKYREFT